MTWRRTSRRPSIPFAAFAVLAVAALFMLAATTKAEYGTELPNTKATEVAELAEPSRTKEVAPPPLPGEKPKPYIPDGVPRRHVLELELEKSIQQLNERGYSNYANGY